MSLVQQIKQSRLIYTEGIGVIVIGVIAVSILTVQDISFHSNYVLLIEEWCHPDNQDAFCTEFRERHGLGITEQSRIGDKYWNELQNQALGLFLLLFSVRFFIAWFLQVAHVRRIRPTSILMAIIWGASGVTLFMFGVLDSAYYLFQDENIPEQLAWLDQAGVFEETKTWFGSTEHVEKEDLFATNLVGFGILGFLIILNMMVFNFKGYKARNGFA